MISKMYMRSCYPLADEARPLRACILIKAARSMVLIAVEI